ncbi:hypothetical protein MKW94_017055 [Papaver nudicaule]|uniref:F-box/LRR-repeat protein 15/At3g58940/PEG3-like LRR domain-containing protein n=1 Tax=Papaver nudicaule TaxID=74823 RepID=A0AA41V508_PAPNU|nr:hypothetical protein [Papaver nudicaule]
MEETTIDSPPESPKHEDRFSLLPNALIHHILSFVADMKITVQMSILSNRWRHVWKSVPALTFAFEYEPGKANNFREFVTRTLMLRDDTDIHSLTVLWIDYLDMGSEVAGKVSTWVLSAARRKVKELVLCVGFNRSQSLSYEFPQCFFRSESLTELHLFMGNMYRSKLVLPESIYLPKLESVKFEDLLMSEVSMNQFFTGCPALKSVTISNCLMGELQIISNTLKHFKIAYSSFDPTINELGTSVLLFAPNLESFDTKHQPSLLFGLSVNSLVKADVEVIVQEKRNFPDTYSEIAGETKDVYATAMMLMLEKLHTVKELTLSPRFIQIISRSPDLWKTTRPQLANLHCMELCTFLSKSCAQAILYLLRISPNIDSLSVRIDKDCFAEQPTDLYSDEINFASETIEDYWKPGLTWPCMPLHLKVVELVDVIGSVNELRFIEVLLKYAAKLEKVVLFWNWDGPGNHMERVMKFNEKLHSLPRASSRVSTLFY